MRVYVGGVETLYPARWYWTDPDAQQWDGPHGCEASPWLKDGEINREWGEVAGPRGLDRGLNPGYLGQCSVGDPQWFLDGMLPANVLDSLPPPVPDCCGTGSAGQWGLPNWCGLLDTRVLYLTWISGPDCLTSSPSIIFLKVAPNRWDADLALIPCPTGFSGAQSMSIVALSGPCGTYFQLVPSGPTSCLVDNFPPGVAEYNNGPSSCNPPRIRFDGVVVREPSSGSFHPCPGGIASCVVTP
jgi:hypothetical protein